MEKNKRTSGRTFPGAGAGTASGTGAGAASGADPTADPAARNPVESDNGAAADIGTETQTTAEKRAARRASKTVATGPAAAPDTIKPRRGRAKKADNMQAAQETVSILLGMFEAAAVGFVGPDAALNPIERPMIEGSLTRILSRTSKASLDRALSLADPLLLMGGVMLYARRMSIMLAQPAAEPTAEPAPPHDESGVPWSDVLSRAGTLAEYRE